MKHVNPKLQRFYEAYLLMAEHARYRPAAPSDGFGNIQLTSEQLRDTHRLQQEAIAYALEFDEEENTDKFWIGCSDYKTNRAFVWSIEAARLLASGDADEKAIVLLEMALEEVQGVRPARLRTKKGDAP
jgi:hypothetical protein